jgi:hypothetical protein
MKTKVVALWIKSMMTAKYLECITSWTVLMIIFIPFNIADSIKLLYMNL